MVPHVPFLNPKRLTDWSTRFGRYDRLGSTVTKTTTLMTGKSTVWLAEPRAVKVVSIDRRAWAKPTEMYKVSRGDRHLRAIKVAASFRRGAAPVHFARRPFADVHARPRTACSQILSMFGSNLVTLEGAAWKAHRRVVGPSFSEPVYSGVAETTGAVVREMMASEGWETLEAGETVEVADMVKVTMRLALVIICASPSDPAL